MAEEKKGFLLRLPPQLFEQLRRWAEQDMRSINGQIEWLLRQAVEKRRGGAAQSEAPPGAPPGDVPSSAP
ncbi:MAG: Arc family DNA-binding protein [Planctomycetes bacterium]|nr:Arc family DNA-binding protein [Planctomycetota bacterium]